MTRFCEVTQTPKESSAGWWVLWDDVWEEVVKLPTFMLPHETEPGDVVELRRTSRVGFFRVAGVY